jgi:lipopolysaccharide transport system ATP-binding protein
VSIIEVSGLSKQYHIGTKLPYKSLRETIMNVVTSPARLFKRNGSGENNTIWALKDVSFEVQQGEVLGIIGRNGAGKTTLLKILSRVTEPTEGEVRIRGRVGSLLEVGTGFHPELTGRENIFLNGAILGMRKEEIKKKFDEIVAFAEVEKFLDTPMKRYSSGMYVRLAFAVAAHLEPEILLVDEVLAVGDAAFQKKCLGKMGDVAKEGRTVLFVSHNMGAILQLCSQAMWLEQGKMAEHNDVRTVVTRYLSDNQVPLGRAKFISVTPHGRARLREIYVMDDSGQIRPDIDYDRYFHLVVEYEVMAKVDRLLVGLKLYNEQNVVAVHTATCDWPETADGIAGEKGRHRAYVLIPGALLAPGRYYCGEIGLWSPDFGHHHHLVGSLMSFEITGGDLRTVGNEVLRPRWPWVSE